MTVALYTVDRRTTHRIKRSEGRREEETKTVIAPQIYTVCNNYHSLITCECSVICRVHEDCVYANLTQTGDEKLYRFSNERKSFNSHNFMYQTFV